MKIIICSSIRAKDEVLKIRQALLDAGHEVEIPHGVKHEYYWDRVDKPDHERAQDKINHDLIRGYYEKMKGYDAVLVVNPELKGVPGYIGGNTFLEMGFAYVLGKPLYCMYPLPAVSYRSELEAMQPVILDGDLQKIR